MKIRIFYIFGFGISVALALIPLACGTNPGPTAPTTPPAPTNTPTALFSPTFTNSPTITHSPTITYSPTMTNSPTQTKTSTLSQTLTPTFTSTNSSTPTDTRTATPTGTSTFTATWTFTPTMTSTPYVVPTSGIYVAGVFARVRVDYLGIPVTAYSAEVFLSVNGSPDASAGVTLTTPLESLIVPYFGTTVISGYTLAQYQTTAPFSYQPGQSYSLAVSTTAGTATGSVVAPGGITDSSDGLQSSWTNEGDGDKIIVQDQATSITTYQAGPDVDSPQTIPGSAYSLGVTYTLTTYCSSTDTSFTNAAAGSGLEALDYFTKLYAFTPTFSPTSTGTATFTPTITNTPVNTNTLTQTFTSTHSPTITDTPTITNTPTVTWTPTVTSTSTNSPTITNTPTVTRTPTNTPTSTPTNYVSGFVTIGASNSFQTATGLRYSKFDGSLWVVDSYNNNLQNWTTVGVQVGSTITSYGSPATHFSSPNGLGIDPTSGNVYVADYFNRQIAVFDHTGSFLTSFGNLQFSSGYPEGAAVNSSGTTVYVLNKIDPGVFYSYSIGGTSSSPTFTYVAALGGSAGLTNPTNLCLDGADNIYVSDYVNHDVLEFNPSGTLLRTFTHPTDFMSPEDVAVDSAGNVYVADSSPSYVFDPSGSLKGQFGAGNFIDAITYDGSSTFYFYDSSYHKIIGVH